MWIDGMGRGTVKFDTGATPRGDLLCRDGVPLGVVVAPGWIWVSGPCLVRVDGPAGDWREWMTKQARYRRAQRHGPRALRSRGWWKQEEM